MNDMTKNADEFINALYRLKSVVIDAGNSWKDEKYYELARSVEGISGYSNNVKMAALECETALSNFRNI